MLNYLRTLLSPAGPSTPAPAPEPAPKPLPDYMQQLLQCDEEACRLMLEAMQCGDPEESERLVKHARQLRNSTERLFSCAERSVLLARLKEFQSAKA